MAALRKPARPALAGPVSEAAPAPDKLAKGSPARSKVASSQAMARSVSNLPIEEPVPASPAAGSAPVAAVPESPACPPPLPRITLAGPPDRAAKGLAGLETRLVDTVRHVAAMSDRRTGALPVQNQANDPILGDLRNAQLFLCVARKAVVAARASLVSPEPDLALARKALRDLGGSLDRVGYLAREGWRLTPGHDPLKASFQGLNEEIAAVQRGLEAVAGEVRKAATKAS